MTENSDSNWLDSISKTTGRPLSEVRSTLIKYGVHAQSVMPRARKVSFSHLAFSGIRKGTPIDGPFEFEWNLAPGLWAVMSDGNFKGKSSILNILQAALRGDFPGKLLSDDVWAWMSAIDVTFLIDQVPHKVEIRKAAGEQNAERATGRILRKGEQWTVLFEGTAGSDLKQHTENLLMEELGFQPIYAHSNGESQPHSWPLYASTLFMSSASESSALFGDVATAGIPLRLLRLFIGFPWVSTNSAAGTARKILESERTASKVATGMEAVLTARLAEVDKAIAVARLAAAAPDERVHARRMLDARDVEMVESKKKSTRERQKLADLETRRDTLVTSLAEAKRHVQQIKDERAAGYVFRKLKPTCCPACEAEYEAVTAAVVEDGTCALCKVDLEPEDIDEDSERLSKAEHTAVEISSSLMTVRAELAACQRTMRGFELDQKTTADEIARLQVVLSKPAEDTETLIIQLQAQANQLTELIGLSSPPQAPITMDETILAAAEAESKKRMLVLQEEVLRDVSTSVMALAQQFGVPNVTSMALNNGGALLIEKGGVNTSFTKLAPGERLRIKIAMALAAVEVARARGYGRHPGLLIIDSPAAQEVVDEDFEVMLANVAKAAKDLGGVQIVIGTVARSELDAVVPFDHRLHAQGHDHLF